MSNLEKSTGCTCMFGNKSCDYCDTKKLASCPFGHSWETRSETINLGVFRAEGMRARARFETVVESPNCPTCGIKWCRLVPRDLVKACPKH
jgi:hypothetical protein